MVTTIFQNFFHKHILLNILYKFCKFHAEDTFPYNGITHFHQNSNFYKHIFPVAMATDIFQKNFHKHVLNILYKYCKFHADHTFAYNIMIDFKQISVSIAMQCSWSITV